MASRLCAALLFGLGAIPAMEPPPWVVGIIESKREEDGRRPCGGAGVVVGRDLILTLAEAMSEGATTATVLFPNGQRRKATIAATNASTAVLLRIERMPDLPAAPLALGLSLPLGTTLWTAGNSFGSIEDDGQVAMSKGIVSARSVIASDAPPVRGRGGQILSRYHGPVLESDAAINDGNQGGPAIDEQGRVFGLVSLGRQRERRLGTIIPMESLLSVLGRDLVERLAPALTHHVSNPLIAAAASAAACVVCVQMDRPRGPGNPEAFKEHVPRPSRLPEQVPAYQRERVRQEWDRYYHYQQLFFTDQPISAIVVSPRDLITSLKNLHGDAKRGQVLLADGRLVDCSVVATHAETDLALLRAERDLGLPVANLSASTVNWGESVAVVGRSASQAHSLTVGIVSTVARRNSKRSQGTVQVDALCNYASLGGAVVDVQGRIIAMPAMMAPDLSDFPWGINSGVAMATDGATILRLLPSLRAGKTNSKLGWVGLGIRFARGLEIASVSASSGAQAAGVLPKDRIIKVGDDEVENIEEFQRALMPYKAQQTVNLTIVRDGQTLVLSVELRELDS